MDQSQPFLIISDDVIMEKREEFRDDEKLVSTGKNPQEFAQVSLNLDLK